MSSSERLIVRVAVLMAGALLMALEIVAFRIIGRSFGTALRETTTVIAVFMLVMSVGYFTGGRIGDRWPRSRVLAVIILAAGATTLLVPSLDAALTDRIATTDWMALHAFLATTVLFAVPTFLLSAVPPVAVRLFAVSTVDSGSVAGSISALSTIGSVAGSLVTAFVLVDALGSMNLTVLLLGCVALVLAAVIALVSAADRTFGFAAAGVAGLAITIVAAGGSANRSPSHLSPGAHLLFQRESQYHSVSVIERGAVRDLWIDRTLQSRLFVGDANLRALEYEEYKHVAKIIRPGLRRMVAIGLGGGTSVRQFTTFYPEMTVDAVEIDPLIVEAARRFFGVEPSDRLRLHVGDGRAWIRAQEGPFDLISIDAYTRGRYGSTIPAHLVTREFFEEVSAKLSADGIVHFHSYAGRDTRFSRAMYRTMAAVFPSVIVLGETELLASNTPIHVEKEDLVRRAGRVRARVPQIDARIGTLATGVREVADVPLLTDDFAPVDMLLRGLRR